MKSLTALALVFLAGCTTDGQLRPQSYHLFPNVPDHQQAEYDASSGEVWAALPDVVKDAGLKLKTADPENYFIYAKHGYNGFSCGENVSVFVKKIDDSKCNVEVVTQRVDPDNVFAPKWGKPIFKALDKQFKRVDSKT